MHSTGHGKWLQLMKLAMKLAIDETCHALSLSPALARKRARVTGYRYAMITFNEPGRSCNGNGVYVWLAAVSE